LQETLMDIRIQPPVGTNSAAPGQLRQDENGPLAAESALETDGIVNRWIQTINCGYGSRVGWIVQTGDNLRQAKAELGRGRWGLLFGEGRLRFGQRRAEMFMQIAAHPTLMNPKFFSDLPALWSVLLILSRLPVGIVEQGIAERQIHSNMTLRQAHELTGAPSAKAPLTQTTEPKPMDDVVDWIQALASYIDKQAPGWPVKFKAQLAAQFRRIAESLVVPAPERQTS
jgi:hypothetical protein